MINKIDMGDW